MKIETISDCPFEKDCPHHDVKSVKVTFEDGSFIEATEEEVGQPGVVALKDAHSSLTHTAPINEWSDAAWGNVRWPKE